MLEENKNNASNKFVEYIETFSHGADYRNKKEIMYRIKHPIKIDDLWEVITNYRKQNSISVSLNDQRGNNFWFYLTPYCVKKLELIDNYASKSLIKNTEESIKSTMMFEALIDEAFNSSAIEGAFSTKKRTKDIIEKKLTPENISEQMIINNYKALEFVLENIHKPIDEDIILTIYNILIEKTLDEDCMVDKYRNDTVWVCDPNKDEPIYIAPPHIEVQLLMDKLIEFINTEDDMHPVIKSCVIHFYFVYIHPFFDGNGRTARALSYMYLLQKGYDFFKFFSISSVIQEERMKYYKAIKDTEDYESDMTYFINYYTTMILNSIIRIQNKFIKEYGRRLIDAYLEEIGIILSKRLKKAVNYYFKSDKNFVTIEEYSNKYKVAYETARTDLNQLVTIGLFKKSKVGKKLIYKISTLEEIIQKIDNQLQQAGDES